MELDHREIDDSVALSIADPKSFGAYYTNEPIAEFLVWWAIPSGTERVIDPSFGGGAFLTAAAKRIQSLGGSPSNQIFGVEIDSKVHAGVTRDFESVFSIPIQNFSNEDFFFYQPGARGFDAVIGNPPFIRYQRFNGTSRKAALDRSAALDVKLTRLSSSWAPFTVLSIALVNPGGRLAFVLPAELTHASYATPVIRYLAQSFGKVTILTFKRKLFPNLNEDTLLLLAGEKGGSCTSILHRDVSSVSELVSIRSTGRTALHRTRRIPVDDIVRGTTRLIERFLPKATRELYQELKRSNLTRSLGEVADVGIGYVTGANDFFHLTRTRADELGINEDFLLPAVRKTKALRGLRFTSEDWLQHVGGNEAEYLFYVRPGAHIPSEIVAYLENGVQSGVSEAYKCKARKLWYSVPHVYQADAFLTYMSGVTPRLVVNEAAAVAPNTLHLVRIHQGSDLSALNLAALWTTSLTRLSAEIQGHSLGGGMLKIEPSEAESCLIANPVDTSQLSDLSIELDDMIRAGRTEMAQEKADAVVLGDMLGLDANDRRMLKDAAALLCQRRHLR